MGIDRHVRLLKKLTAKSNQTFGPQSKKIQADKTVPLNSGT
jgi:hypothetical protein